MCLPHVRSGRRITLTSTNRTLYPQACELAELTTATLQDMAGEATALRSCIRIGVVAPLLGNVVTPVLARLLVQSSAVQAQLRRWCAWSSKEGST
ncbi:hypothetical protein ACX12L_15050 [Alicycliphilus sp. T452]|jgi:DNA-binding transcriptional LysR family regulator